MTFSSLKECELSRIIHYHEFAQQGLNDLTSPCSRQNMQVLNSILRQVKGGTALHGCAPPCAPPGIQAHEEIAVDLAIVILDFLLSLSLRKIRGLPLYRLILKDRTTWI